MLGLLGLELAVLFDLETRQAFHWRMHQLGIQNWQQDCQSLNLHQGAACYIVAPRVDKLAVAKACKHLSAAEGIGEIEELRPVTKLQTNLSEEGEEGAGDASVCETLYCTCKSQTSQMVL